MSSNSGLRPTELMMAEAQAITGVMVSFCEVVFVAALPAIVARPAAASSSGDSAASAAGGTGGTNQAAGQGAGGQGGGQGATAQGASRQGDAWVRLSGGALLLRGTVADAEHDLLSVGMPVAFGDSGNAPAGDGAVSAIEPTGLSAASRWQVTITPKQPLAPGTLGLNVRLSVAVRSTGAAVLVVPLAAVSARADGSTHVTKVVGGTEADVSVRAGLSADGFVEVTPRDASSLDVVDRVVVGR